MPANVALPCICGLSFAIKLHERAEQDRIFGRRDAVVAFERSSYLSRQIGPAGCQVRIHRIAKVPGALSSVCKINEALQIATAAMPGRNHSKRTICLTDNVKP